MGAIYVEKSIVVGSPYRDQQGLRLGEALVSPQVDARGADIYRNMRRVSIGDVILHLVDNKAFTGFSFVAAPAQEYKMPFEEWYKVPLVGFTPLIPPLPKTSVLSQQNREKLIAVATESRNVFYTKKMTLLQGAYLTYVPDQLFRIITDTYKQLTGLDLKDLIAKRQAASSLKLKSTAI